MYNVPLVKFYSNGIKQRDEVKKKVASTRFSFSYDYYNGS